MNKYTQKTLAAYLASATISMSPGLSADMLPAMEKFPMKLVEDILDEVAYSDMDNSDKLKTFSTVTADSRPEVRVRICELLASNVNAYSFSQLSPMIEKLAADRNLAVQKEVRRTIARALLHADPLRRTQMAAEWALSDSELIRATVAEVLCENFVCLGVSAVAQHLAMDESLRVQRNVLQMAAGRLHENPEVYRQIIQQMSQHAHQKIRLEANNALERLQGIFPNPQIRS